MSRSGTRWPRGIIEGFVIVVSILLALAADAWWDGQQVRAAKAELIEAVRGDFAATRDELAQALQYLEGSTARTAAYLDVVRSGDAIGTDSLSLLYQDTFAGFVVTLRLSNYDGAVTSGSLRSIASPELMEALTRFDGFRDWWEVHLRVLGDVHYRGPTWELRKQLGTQYVLVNPERAPNHFRLSDAELRAVLTGREAYAVAEVHAIIFRNIQASFSQMDEAAEAVLAVLEG